MSNVTHSAISTQDGENTRQRHSQEIARLLKEYTAVVYEIAHQTGTALDSGGERSNNKLPTQVLVAVWRYRSIWGALRDAALLASQMLVHYQLDEANAAELRLRVADAENGITSAGVLISALGEKHSEVIGGILPDEYELDALANQLRTALKK